MTDEVKEEVERLIRSGEREKAVQYLRSTFTLSDREAVLLVETLEREIGVEQPDMSSEAQAADSDDVESLKNEVAEMVKAGRRSEALAYIRKTKKVGLGEALIMMGEAAREAKPNLVSLNLAGCITLIAKGLGVFFMIVSVMLLVAASVIYFIQNQSIENSDRVSAVVSEMKSSGSGAEAPVVEFEWRGDKISYASTFYSSPPHHTVGEQVFVFVNRDDPGDITIDTFTERWALIVGLSVPGAVLMALSIVFLYFGKRKF